MPKKKKKEGKTKKKEKRWSMNHRALNRSHSGISVIHTDHIKLYNLRKFFYSHLGGRLTSTSPHFSEYHSYYLKNSKKAANYSKSLAAIEPTGNHDVANAACRPRHHTLISIRLIRRRVFIAGRLVSTVILTPSAIRLPLCSPRLQQWPPQLRAYLFAKPSQSPLIH